MNILLSLKMVQQTRTVKGTHMAETLQMCHGNMASKKATTLSISVTARHLSTNNVTANQNVKLKKYSFTKVTKGGIDTRGVSLYSEERFHIKI